MRSRWLSFAIAPAAGLAQAFSTATPWNGQPAWWLQLLSLAVLAWLVQDAGSWRRAALLGWAFATAWLCGTFWWLFISMHVYGGLAAPLAVIAVLGLAAFLASYYALVLGCFRALAPMHAGLSAIVFAASWLLAELMRTTWFTGFPWGAGGYAHVEGPLALLAPYVGVHGIGFVAAVLAFGLSLAARREVLRSWDYWAGVVACIAVLLGGAVHTLKEKDADDYAYQQVGKLRPLSVALLQGNIPQDEKFEPGSGIPLALDWYADELRRNTASLVVTPETAIPLLPRQLPEGYLDDVTQRFTRSRQAALIGIPLGSLTDGYTNSVIGFKAGDNTYQYHKHHLVPFGEFIPPLFKWFVRMMNIPLGDFNRGAVGQASFEWQGHRLAPNICYEDLFGEELGARFADAAKAPTAFVNVSNIGWFGDSIAIDQHLQISRMRTLEFERPMLRATNTGATVIIDHRGRVKHELPRHTRGVLNAEFEGRDHVTPYAAWVSRLGLWPLWLLAAGVPLLAYFMRTRRPGRASVT